MSKRPHHLHADAESEFQAFSLSEVLDADSRPTFVLDLELNAQPASHLSATQTLPAVFCNEALRYNTRLYGSIFGHGHGDSAATQQTRPSLEITTNAAFATFKAWAEGLTTQDSAVNSGAKGHVFNDLLWTGSVVRRRWKLISGNPAWRPPNSPASALGYMPSDNVIDSKDDPGESRYDIESVGSRSIVSQLSSPSDVPSMTSFTPPKAILSSYTPFIPLSSPELAVADWTVPHPKGLLSPHLQFARSVKWDKTPLGPMQSWSREFRQLANLCMRNPHPAALFWGSELTMLYNEAYAAEVAGNKHPSLMGTGFSGPFAELWDYAGPIFAECARTGTSVRKDRDYLPIDRQGIVEETFYNWSFTPLYGGTDRILGFYNAPFECTQEVIGKRRMQLVNHLGERTSQAKTINRFWSYVLDCFQDYHYDIPFALLYSVDEADEAAAAGDTSGLPKRTASPLERCLLEGSLGIPDGHRAIPPQLDLSRSTDGFVPSFRTAVQSREPTMLDTRDGSLPGDLIQDFQWRGFGDPCRQAIVFPVRPTNEDRVLALLVLGVAPRRIFDDEYEAFVRMLNRQLATSLASVILYESEVRRARDAAEAAASQQELLKQELSLQANRLRRMTERSPSGMFLVSPDGVLLEANEQFYEMTGLVGVEHQCALSWTDCIAESSLDAIQKAWAQMHDEHTSWSGELLLRNRHPDQNVPENHMEPWVIFTADVETNSDGSLRSVMGSLTDISHLKWAQNLQNHQLQEAEEIRKKQNEFIDITSHEMRNPLSAMLQCTEDILACITESHLATPSAEDLASVVEAASTIAVCVQHQKAIVDDVLTFSKLNANLLQITPITVQPMAILKRAVKMFESELQAKNIQVAFEQLRVRDPIDIQWAVFDPGRVLQILINLISNAIKFTELASTRTITVATATSTSPPAETDFDNFYYAPPDTEPAEFESRPNGQPIYVCFKVCDTSCGLSPEEQHELFKRFKQATPRTHAIYGGSGLGLFISKKLAELLGGRIGLASASDQGTMFLVYVQAWHTHTKPSTTSANDSMTARQRQQPPSSSSMKRTRDSEISDGESQPQKYSETKISTAMRSQYNAAAPSYAGDAPILIVEDNLINQKVLAKQLRKLGYPVQVANDGYEALDFLQKSHFCTGGGVNLSLILMDLEMPRMDGLTCVREIRSMQDQGRIYDHVPVIAVTANVRDEQIMEAKEAGMDDVVSKPFSVKELVAKMQPWL